MCNLQEREVAQAPVQTEIKVGYDHLMVTVQAEACAECGEAYYSAETLRYIERIGHDSRKSCLSDCFLS